MKKNITIGVLVAITIMSILFAYSQKIRAKQTEMIAIKQTELANIMKEQLEQQKLIAQQEAIRASIAEDSARVAMTRAMKAEERCK